MKKVERVTIDLANEKSRYYGRQVFTCESEIFPGEFTIGIRKGIQDRVVGFRKKSALQKIKDQRYQSDKAYFKNMDKVNEWLKLIPESDFLSEVLLRYVEMRKGAKASDYVMDACDEVGPLRDQLLEFFNSLSDSGNVPFKISSFHDVTGAIKEDEIFAAS